MRIRYLLGTLSIAILAVACETNGANSGKAEPEAADSIEVLAPPERPCGNSILVDVRDMEGNSVGVFETLNDDRHLWLIYSPNLSNRLIRVNLYVGPAESIPRDGRGNDLMSEFPLRIDNREGAIGWMHPIPLDSLPKCFVVAACLNIADRELVRPLPKQIRYAWSQSNRTELGLHSISYCPGSCDPIANQCPGGTEPGQFCTLPPKSWVEENGEWNRYMKVNFEQAFPNGLQLGCEKKMVFTSVEALGEFLPASGPGKVLTTDEENPKDQENGLAAEICALTLSIGLDNYDDDFCLSPARLAVLQVASGPFAGWEVSDILNEANIVLGGCASNYSPGQMEEVLRSVNENFAAGKHNRGFLSCDGN